MNIQEKRYVLKRIEEIEQTLMRSVMKKYPSKASKRLHEREKLEIIASGKVISYTPKQMRRNSGDYNFPGLSKIFDFSEYEWDAKSNEKYNIVMSLLNDEKTRISDEIMLGDAEEAMKALKEFAEFKI